MSDNISERSEFNSNLATLERIDDLLKKCREAAFVGDLSAWFKFLRNLRKEAQVKMPDDEKEKCTKEYKSLEKIHELYLLHADKKGISKTFDRNLDEFELYLREFMNKKGMLLRDDEDRGL